MTTKAKDSFTPGPWRHHPDYRGGKNVVYVEALVGGERCEHTVAHAYDGSLYDNQAMTEANARLIAAAPDLLEAGKRLLEHLREAPLTPAYGRMAAAIRKAEGRS